VDLNIEDNPVLPVVWKGRLFLFWLSVMQTGSDQGSSGDDTALNLTNVKPSELKGVAGEAETRVTVTLYWSEYYNGKWQPPRTSDVNKPIRLSGAFAATGTDSFDRARLRLRSYEQNSGALLIQMYYIGRRSRCSFKLYNTHSLPIRSGEESIQMNGHVPFTGLVKQRTLGSAGAPFTIDYGISYLRNDQFVEGDSLFGSQVLNRSDLYTTVEPRHQLEVIYEAPFFFQDRRHVFFVHSEQGKVVVGGYRDFGILRPPRDIFAEPEILVQPDFPGLREEVFSPTDLMTPGVVDPSPMGTFLKNNGNVHRIIGAVGTIQFGKRLIGPGGSFAPNFKR
jgi:hypothetical protein